MELVIKAIEEKLKSQETDIYLLKMENERLKKELAEHDKIIAEQANIIGKMN